MLPLSRTKSFKGKAKKATKHTPLFDIRLNTADRDVILLKGSPDGAPPSFVSGVVVLSVTEPINVKKMSLQLVAEIDMHWDEKFKSAQGTVYTRPFHHNRVIFNYEWDPLNLREFLAAESENANQGSSAAALATLSSPPSYGSLVGFVRGHQAASNSSSSSSLASMGAAASAASALEAQTTLNAASQILRASVGNTTPPLTKSASSVSLRKNRSATSLAALSFVGHVEPTTIPAGNYEFPFQTVVPGGMPESIDGLRGCTVAYRLQSVLERGRFSTPIITRRLVHVIRTLPADASELTETVAVDNTWPGKVDYSLSVPTRALAVGSACSVELTLVPLLKGLRLGAIKIRLAEYSSLACTTSAQSLERYLATKLIPKVEKDPVTGVDVWSADSPVDADGTFYRGTDGITLMEDRWTVRTVVQIPASLAKVTQDCDVGNWVKVRHKLKFSIGLINPDGHVSELRATLPITIFVSPFVPVRSSGIKTFDKSHSVSGYEDATVYPPGGDELLFEASAGYNVSAATRSSSGVVSLTGSPIDTPTGSTTNLNTQLNTQDLMAPPSYERHRLDRPYDINGELRPAEASSAPATQPVDVPRELNMVPTDTSSMNHLFSSLNRHSTSASPVTGSSPSDRYPSGRSGRAMFTFAGDEPLASAPAPDVISGPAFENGSQAPMTMTSSYANLPPMMSPPVMTPVQHLSRATSFVGEPTSPTGTGTGTPHADHWNTTQLSRVPSYETAIMSDGIADELTPAYEPPEFDSRINLDLLDSRLANVGQRTAATRPLLDRSRSQGSVLHLSPSKHSSTSLLGKQFHKLHRITSLEHVADSIPEGSPPPPMTRRKVKSVANFGLFHKD